MLSFPVKYRPEFEGPFLPPAIEYTNVIDQDLANELISLATNHDGWHRRGSKSKFIEASFSTTLLHDLNHPIYSILDNYWQKATDEYGLMLDFVEVYEVKEYKCGDMFGPHIDSHEKIDVILDRKLNCILQLSDATAYEGGDLYIKDYTASKNLGSLIFFPANYQHQVTKVTSGTRYSLIGHGWGNVYRR